MDAPDDFKWCIDDDGDLLAPWLVFPEIHPMSIGWRMGAGEDYLHLFASQYLRRDGDVDDVVRRRLRRKHPAPTYWPFFWMRNPIAGVVVGFSTFPLAFAIFKATLPVRMAAARRRGRPS